MSNEFMGKTYNFDPNNVLTRGLPVPPGYRPLAPGKAPRAGDFFQAIGCSAAMDRLPLWGPDYFEEECRWEDDLPRSPDDIYFRRIDWSPDLLSRIPEGFEAYDRPGEPPESVQGWKFIAYTHGVQWAGHAFTTLGQWTHKYTKPISEYGRTWCLARPKKPNAELSPNTDEHTCGEGLAVGGHCFACEERDAPKKPDDERPAAKPKIRCADCDAAVEMVDGQPMRVCACVDPEAERERHRAQFWRVADHPSRKERDARAIDALPNLYLSWWRDGWLYEPPRDDSEKFPNLRSGAGLMPPAGREYVNPEPHDERLSVQVQHEDEV